MAPKLFQHAAGKNVGERSYDDEKHVEPSLENCKVCGITTQRNARAVISNPAGKINVGKNSKRIAVSMWARKKILLYFSPDAFEPSAILPS